MNTHENYSRRHVIASMQMLEWAVTQMYVYGSGEEAVVKARQNADIDALRALKIMELAISMGQLRFRDHIADLAHAHVDGERMGLRSAGIATYDRSHDTAWTQCFMTFCCELTNEGFRLSDAWADRALKAWRIFGDEISKGHFPDQSSLQDRQASLLDFRARTCG